MDTTNGNAVAIQSTTSGIMHNEMSFIAPDTALSVFRGEIDFSGRNEFRSQLVSLEAVPTAIVDFSDVTYLDSSAISEILSLQRNRTKNGLSAPRFVLGAKVRRFFEIAGLNTVLQSFPSVEEATTG